MICVSVGTGSPAQAKKILLTSGFIELRADLLNWKPEDYRNVILSGGKTIFTCRPGKLKDEERLGLFALAADAGAKFIDIEIESQESFQYGIKKIIEKVDTELIVSYHNYVLTPSTEALESVLNDCFLAGADVTKIACRVFSQADGARLLSLYNISGRKVVIGMGKTGKITRVAASLLGAEFTFAASGNGDETAEGQFTYDEMKELIKKIQ